MNWLAQVPKELPPEFGFEVDGGFNSFTEMERAGFQVKLFCDAMMALGYTVYKWQDMDRFCTCYKFRK